jgi:hypothetical protein
LQVVANSAFFHGEYSYVTLYLGKVENVPILWDNNAVPYGGGAPIQYTVSTTQGSSITEETSTNTTIEHSVADSTSASFTWGGGIEGGIGGEIGGGGGFLSASKNWSLKLSLDAHWSQETSHTETESQAIQKGFSTAQEKYIENSSSFTISIGGDDGYPAGKYRYTTFGTCYMYAHFVFGWEGGEPLAISPYCYYPENEYEYKFDVAPEGSGFVAESDDKLSVLSGIDMARAAALSAGPFANRVAIAHYPGMFDVFGYEPEKGGRMIDGKLTYTYKVLEPGKITVALIGGGAGGAGATAVTDGGWWADGFSSAADAGWSAAGGDTVLRVKNNNGVINSLTVTAKGGEKVDGIRFIGVDHDHRESDGPSGGDGQGFVTPEGEGTPVSKTFDVKRDDIITIEVGYGGGGSGGAANSTDGGTASSGSAVGTAYSLGHYRGSGDANYHAPRGGAGALHGLTSTGGSIPQQKGENAPKARNDIEGGKGGQSRGAGGAGGKAYKGDGMTVYVSGGGGGAAGGFTLTSQTVAVEVVFP